MMANISVDIVLEYEDEVTAENIRSSLEPDSEGYVDIEVRGANVHCTAKAGSPKKLLNTVDDLLACVTVAEESIER